MSKTGFTWRRIAGLTLWLMLTWPGIGHSQTHPQPQTIVINTPAINLRSGPNNQSEVIKVVRNGTKLDILAEQAGWYQVKLPDGATGWITKSAVSAGNTAKTRNALMDELKSQLSAREEELSAVRIQLEEQIGVNAQLKNRLGKAQQAAEQFSRQAQQAEKWQAPKQTAKTAGWLVAGCLLGFTAGFFYRRAEDKRFIKMMVEVESSRRNTGEKELI